MRTNSRSMLVVGMILALVLSLMPVGIAEAASSTNANPAMASKVIKAKSVTSVSLNKKTLTLNVGAKSKLTATVKPADATNKKVTWKSSKTSVATVNSTGTITATKAGTATITVTTASGKKITTCKVTVVVPVKSVKLNSTSKSLKEKGTYQVKATVSPSNATTKTVTWSSSNKSIAKVDSKGKVTAVAAGTATITAKAGDKTAKCKITVTAVKKPVKRAYLVGQANYKDARDRLPSSGNDVLCVAYMLAAGGYNVDNIYIRSDLTAQGLAQFMNSMSTSGIASNDITLFYYSGHGASSDIEKYRGALVGTDDTIVTVNDVQKFLDKVPGTVVVALDCCLAGQYIQPKSFSTSDSSSTISPTLFNQSVISAFSGSGMMTKALPDSPQKSKYKIITSCKPMENSTTGTVYGEPISLFSYLFAMGGGFNFDTKATGSMLADTNKDKVATLKELQTYINKQAIALNIITQSVMIWPTNDTFGVVSR